MREVIIKGNCDDFPMKISEDIVALVEPCGDIHAYGKFQLDSSVTVGNISGQRF